MRKKVLFIFMLSVLVLSSFLPTMNAFAAEKTAVLVDLRFVPVKGWAVVFEITGDWKQSDLKGNTLTVGGHTFNLYCNFRDNDHISCTMEALGQFIGQTATIYFAGQTYSAIVPDKNYVLLECPSGYYEFLEMYGEDSDGFGIFGYIGYPSELFTIDEAVAAWVSESEDELETDIVYYQVLSISCEPFEFEKDIDA